MKNLSYTELDDNYINVFAKGFNLTTGHSEKDKLQFIAQVESTIEDMKDINIEKKNKIR